MTLLMYILIGCLLAKMFFPEKELNEQRRVIALSIVLWPLMLVFLLIAGD